MKKINIFIIILIYLIIITLFYFLIIVDIKTYDYTFNVGDHTGFNVDNDKFYFGTLMQGSNSVRFFTIKNEEYDARYIIKAYGDFSDKLWISENNFKLKKEEEKALKINLFTNETIQKGIYSGKIVFILIRF